MGIYLHATGLAPVVQRLLRYSAHIDDAISAVA
jgi:hypothetical protein